MGRSARSYAGSGVVEVSLQPRYLSVHSAYPGGETHHHHHRTSRYYPSSSSRELHSGYLYHPSGGRSSSSGVSAIVVNRSRPSSLHRKQMQAASASSYYGSSSRNLSPIPLPPMQIPPSPITPGVMSVPVVGRESKRYYSSTYHMSNPSYHHQVPMSTTTTAAMPPTTMTPTTITVSPTTDYNHQLRHSYHQSLLSASSSRSSSTTSLFSHSSARSSVSSIGPGVPPYSSDFDRHAKVVSAEPSPDTRSRLEEHPPISLPAINIHYPAAVPTTTTTTAQASSSSSTIGGGSLSGRRKRSGSFLENTLPYDSELRGPSMAIDSRSAAAVSMANYSFTPESPSPNTLAQYVPLSKTSTPPDSVSPMGRARDFRELSVERHADAVGAANTLVSKLQRLCDAPIDTHRVRNFISSARLNIRIYAIACHLLESLSLDFWKKWREEVYKCQLATRPELVILGVLSLSMKFEEDKSFSASYWARAIAQNIVTTRDVTNCERVLLNDINFRIAKIAREEDHIKRILGEIQAESRAYRGNSMNSGMGASMKERMGFGKYPSW